MFGWNLYKYTTLYLAVLFTTVSAATTRTGRLKIDDNDNDGGGGGVEQVGSLI